MISSEPVGLAIVWFLIFLSVISWAVVARKLLQFWRGKAGNRKFLNDFKTVDNDFHLAYERAQTQRGTPLADVFSEIYRELRALAKNEAGKIVVTPGTVNLVQRAADRQVALIVSELERYLSILGTIAFVCPLLGLLGTVWGVMVAFQDMGTSGTTDLTVVGPGIASALIATAAGLFAAIPASICYNYFNRGVETQLGEMEDFISRLVSFLDRSVQRRAGKQPTP